MKQGIREVGAQLAKDKSLKPSPFINLLREAVGIHEKAASIGGIGAVNSKQMAEESRLALKNLLEAENLTSTQKISIEFIKATLELVLVESKNHELMGELTQIMFLKTDIGKECQRITSEVFTDTERAKHYILANEW